MDWLFSYFSKQEALTGSLGVTGVKSVGKICQENFRLNGKVGGLLLCVVYLTKGLLLWPKGSYQYVADNSSHQIEKKITVFIFL